MGMLWPTLEFILGVSMIITLLAGGHLVIAHRIHVGQFVAFNTYMIMLIWPIIAVGWVVNIFQRGTASVKRIDELLRAKPAIDDRAADPAIAADTVLRGEIEFRNLSFSYGETPVLHDISLRIPAGSSLAIVGPQARANRHWCNLISRLYEAPEGSLLIDGRPVREYPLAVLRRNIGMVPQETFLFSETIREKLAFGAPDASAEDLLEAAEAAHIRQEFEEFPQGFETMVGERGVTLSRRPEATRRHCARAAAPARDSDSRRCAGQRGHLHRRAHSRRIAQLHGHLNHDSHLASRFHGAQCRPDCRAGPRAALWNSAGTMSCWRCDGYYASLYQKQQLEEELTVAG